MTTRGYEGKMYYLDKKKKEPSPRFAARRKLFDLVIMLDHERSAQVRDFCPALIARDRESYHTWNSVLLAADLEDGSFFCPG